MKGEVSERGLRRADLGLGLFVEAFGDHFDVDLFADVVRATRHLHPHLLRRRRDGEGRREDIEGCEGDVARRRGIHDALYQSLSTG